MLGLFFGALLAGAAYIGGRTVSINRLIKTNAAKQNAASLQRLPQNTLVPLGNSRVLAGTTSTQVEPIYYKNGLAYFHKGTNLVPVEPIFTMSSGGKVQNVPFVETILKNPNAFNINKGQLKLNYTSPLLQAPGPTTQISNANAAKLLAELNAGKVKLPNVSLNKVQFKPAANASSKAISIKNLSPFSRAVIEGTTTIHELKPAFNVILQKLAANKSLRNSLRAGNVNTLPAISNTGGVIKYVDRLFDSQVCKKVQRFLGALPVQVSTNQKLLNINFQSTLINWKQVETRSKLSATEVQFFRSIFSDPVVMNTFNKTLQALPNKPTNTNKVRGFAALFIGGLTTFIMSDAGSMAIAGLLEIGRAHV